MAKIKANIIIKIFINEEIINRIAKEQVIDADNNDETHFNMINEVIDDLSKPINDDHFNLVEKIFNQGIPKKIVKVTKVV